MPTVDKVIDCQRHTSVDVTADPSRALLPDTHVGHASISECANAPIIVLWVKDYDAVDLPAPCH